MASPQLENGHLKIANEVWDHLMSAGLTGSEFQVILAVIRRTWGWQRKETEISLAEFCRMTGQPERTAARCLVSLQGKNVLSRIRGGGKGRPSTWSFNKDWESWKHCHSRQSIPNSAISYTVMDGSQTLSGMAELTARNGRVSSGKLLDTNDIEPPKASIKEKKAMLGDKSPSVKARKTDPAYEIFCSEFAGRRGIPYRGKRGDFVQLHDLRKALGCGGREVPRHWTEATRNFFASPLSRYTLADLCSRFDVFRLGRLNQYGKPEAVKGPAESRLATDEDKRSYNPNG